MKGNEFTTKEQQVAASKKRKEKKQKRERKTSKNVTQIMNGEFLTKDFVVNNLNFIFFIIFLLVLVVTKGYYVRQLANDITKAEKQLRDVTADYVETKAKLGEKTRRTKLIKELAPMGLKETMNPTKVIRLKDKNKEAK